MKHSELPVYQGENDSCAQCGRGFKEGEIITVAGNKETFCYSTGEGGCLINYVFKTGKQMTGMTMRFRK